MLSAGTHLSFFPPPKEGEPYNPSLPEETKALVAKAQGYLDDMWARGVMPSATTVHTLLKFIVRSKQIGKARACYERILHFGMSLTPEIVTLMSHATYDSMVAKQLV